MYTGRRVALIVGLSVLGIAVFAVLGVLLSRAAAKQSADCNTRYAESSRLVAAGDPGARASIEMARARCMSGLKVAELAALETKPNSRSQRYRFTPAGRELRAQRRTRTRA